MRGKTPTLFFFLSLFHSVIEFPDILTVTAVWLLRHHWLESFAPLFKDLIENVSKHLGSHKWVKANYWNCIVSHLYSVMRVLQQWGFNSQIWEDFRQNMEYCEELRKVIADIWRLNCLYDSVRQDDEKKLFSWQTHIALPASSTASF